MREQTWLSRIKTIGSGPVEPDTAALNAMYERTGTQPDPGNHIDLEHGILRINGREYGPETTFGSNNGCEIIPLGGRIEIDGHAYLVELILMNKKLYAISLMCVDREFTMETERERQALHDEILRSYSIEGAKSFKWGTVESYFDPKSWCSSILLSYRNGTERG